MKTTSQSKTQLVPAPFSICHRAREMELHGLTAVTVLDSSFPNAFGKLSHTKENGEDSGPRCLLHPVPARRATYSEVLVLGISSHQAVCTHHTLLGAPRRIYLLAILS